MARSRSRYPLLPPWRSPSARSAPSADVSTSSTQRKVANREPSVVVGLSRSAVESSVALALRAAVRSGVGAPRAMTQMASGSSARHTLSSAAPRSGVPPGALRSVNQRSAAAVFARVAAAGVPGASSTPFPRAMATVNCCVGMSAARRCASTARAAGSAESNRPPPSMRNATRCLSIAKLAARNRSGSAPPKPSWPPKRPAAFAVTAVGGASRSKRSAAARAPEALSNTPRAAGPW